MIAEINKDTLLCMSLSGRPGNFGTRFHNFLYSRMKLNFIYKAFTTTDIQSAVNGIRALGIRGCAVSMPFKESCMEFLDEMDSSAQGIQSVNTILNTNGVLRGSNTDYIAVRDLLVANKISPDSVFALFGSGGMAKAMACALKEIGFKNGSIVSRNSNTGNKLAHQYGFTWIETIENKMDTKFEILINASPIGMAGGIEAQLSPFSEALVKRATIVFDVVAMPVETPLIKSARFNGKKVITGIDVMILQAVEQFVLYTGVRPDASLILEAAEFARS